MNEKITDNLTVIERRFYDVSKQDDFYSKYKSIRHIGNKQFTQVIEELGGYVYNTCVGKIGNVIIFNGITWLGIHRVRSYEECDKWVQEVDKKLWN